MILSNYYIYNSETDSEIHILDGIADRKQKILAEKMINLQSPRKY